MLQTVFYEAHLHLVMAQPVRVLHIVDSVAIVVEIVDVRDPVVVVVHVNVIWDSICIRISGLGENDQKQKDTKEKPNPASHLSCRSESSNKSLVVLDSASESRA